MYQKCVPTCRRPTPPLARGADRAVFDGILWVLKTGVQWAAVPPTYPSTSTCHRRLQAWGAAGMWPQLFRAPLRYQRRWKIARCFAWLGNGRRPLIRWDYYVDHSVGFLLLACSMILLKRILG